MDKKSKIFFLVFFLFLAGSVFATYYRVVIARDYVILGQTDCDPTTENCFIYECDSEAEECTGDPEEDTWYYKKVNRKAANIPLCDPNDENCEALVCGEGEDQCEEILCSEETMTEGDVCSDPETYNAENPAEEECEDGDEECLSAEETECEDPSGAEAGSDEECLAAEGEDASTEEAEEDVSGESEDAGDTENGVKSEEGDIGDHMDNPIGSQGVPKDGFPLVQ